MSQTQAATHALVADSGTARLMRVTGPRLHREIAQVETFSRPSAHLHVHELVSDHPGRAFESSGRAGVNATHTRHGVGGDYDPHTAEIERYVERILQRLVALHRAHGLSQLMLIAEPRLLGMLRAQLPAELQKLVVREISGDYVHADHAQLLSLVDAAA